MICRNCCAVSAALALFLGGAAPPAGGQGAAPSERTTSSVSADRISTASTPADPVTSVSLPPLPESSGTTSTLLPEPPPRGRITSVPLHLSQLSAPQATSESRAQQFERMQRVLNEAVTTEPLPATARTYASALYAATLLPPDDTSREVVRRALRAYASTDDEEFQRMSLESAYGVDTQAFLAEMATIAEVTSSPKHFAMTSLYLVRGLPEGAGARRDALERLRRRFPAWRTDPILTMLAWDLIRSRNSSPEGKASGPAAAGEPAGPGVPETRRPPLGELLSGRFAPGFPVVYTLQRPDRSWPGLALVRRPDGRFHRNPDGTLFRISHLARSRTNLPGYITNGNTPQGIFSVQGLGRSRTRAIGSTPYLHTFLPFEASPERYFHDPALAGTSWTLDLYRRLLPDSSTTAGAARRPSWRDDLPIRTAWYAGEAGRFDILSHGTTVDPALSEGKTWYPGSPTSGCICAKEIWDEATGKALHSDQLALVHAWLRAAGMEVPYDGGEGEIAVENGPKGFFVVVELDDKPQPVTLDEVLTDVLHAEQETGAE